MQTCFGQTNRLIDPQIPVIISTVKCDEKVMSLLQTIVILAEQCSHFMVMSSVQYIHYELRNEMVFSLSSY